MTHLDEGRLGEALDGRMDRADVIHLESCAACRTQLAELRAVLEQVAAVPIPPPSPLFWEHFRTRVARAIDEPGAMSSAWPIDAGFRWLTAASAVLTLALVLVTISIDPGTRADPAVAVSGSATASTGVDDMEQDEAWALVRSLAADLDFESVHDAGVAPAPGAVDRAAVELSPSEQTALVELLEQEMKRTDS